jgi:hypothetical protein
MAITIRGIAKEGQSGFRGDCSLEAWLATVVLTITTYFHHVRLLGLFAVFAAILTVLFGRAITSGVRTF